MPSVRPSGPTERERAVFLGKARKRSMDRRAGAAEVKRHLTMEVALRSGSDRVKAVSTRKKNKTNLKLPSSELHGVNAGIAQGMLITLPPPL